MCSISQIQGLVRLVVIDRLIDPGYRYRADRDNTISISQIQGLVLLVVIDAGIDTGIDTYRL